MCEQWLCKDCGREFVKNIPQESPTFTGKITHPEPLQKALHEADKIINGERKDQYGSPEDSFPIIAGYWNVFLEAKLGPEHADLLTPLDVTNMMILFKQARKLGQKPKRDNYIDSIGYEAIGADRLWED